MAQGIFYSRSTKGVPKDIITWHDKLPIRIFIHSQENEDTSRTVLSITTQLVGEKPLKPSEEEKSLRLKIAKLGAVAIDESLNSAQMRKTAFGLLLEQHSLLISSEMQKSNNFKSQEISLVSQIKSRTNPNIQIVLLDTPEEMANLGGSANDVILIAKIYSAIYTSGSTKVAKRTADALRVDLETVRTAVRIARRNKWLTSLGHGKSGGLLTKEGEKKFREANGPYRIQKLLGLDFDKKVK